MCTEENRQPPSQNRYHPYFFAIGIMYRWDDSSDDRAPEVPPQAVASKFCTNQQTSHHIHACWLEWDQNNYYERDLIKGYPINSPESSSIWNSPSIRRCRFVMGLNEPQRSSTTLLLTIPSSEQHEVTSAVANFVRFADGGASTWEAILVLHVSPRAK